ncbi:MAG: hypothetical protein IPL79_02195 [Myxococcales bacterium]|nr:hypothetical protein [Myxococcales bacterium]
MSASGDAIICASAPGKVVIAGEYAVTRGGPGLVAVVNRRATARALKASDAPLQLDDRFVRAALAVLSAEFGEASAAVIAARATRVDTRAFYQGDEKLGLGASAATVVALIARAVACHASQAFANDAPTTQRIFALAARAHAEEQRSAGASGSGIDVAAACIGGFAAFVQGVASPLPAPSVAWVAFYTGHGASTPALLAGVARAEQAAPGPVQDALLSLAKAAGAAIEACRDGDADALIGSLGYGHLAMHQLAHATALPLVPPIVDRVAALASALGGTAKTTGAGGGDVALAVVPIAQGQALEAAMIAAGAEVLPLTLGGAGVHVAIEP